MKGWHKAALVAWYKGYRISDDGELVNGAGQALVLKAKKSDRGYPRFGVWFEDEKRAVRIAVHKYAAFCFFGLKAFSAPCIRHRNDCRTDFSRGNLLLGTEVDNCQDKCPKQRSRVASIAGSHSPAAVAYQELQDGCPDGSKVCSLCLDTKEHESFGVRSDSRDGYSYRCKLCIKELRSACKERNAA